ncbi:hypothetical protein JG688_00015051 [Phytophthora aleatoria]|uniref:Uncharacterized protein n=1 Tax=Phytophthora aleatoria TaxID=2496075 RepID=A0A8J5IEX7_9STRA|nr:hypothetical protein JG688_00015051 [Phytophthora aleatoria]
MVRSICPNSTSTNAQVSGFYFRPCRNEYDEAIPEYFRCRCAETGSVPNFARHSSWNLYGWMHWIIEPPPSFLREPNRETETLRLDVSGATQAVEQTIAGKICCFKKDGELVTGLAPLTNEPNDDLSARTHLQFLAKMLPRDYGVQIEQCCSLVENCSVNRLFATLMGVHWWAALAAA